MVSIKRMVDCLEYYSAATSNISIVKHFYGLLTTAAPRRLSLLKQVQLLRGRHVHLNIFLVATPASKNSEIAAAVQRARDIFAKLNFGIARVLYYDISAAVSRGRENLKNAAEAKALTHEWTALVALPRTIDVFFVLSWGATSTLGLSPRPGPCDKHDACIMTGSVVLLSDPTGVRTGQTLAHELGHFLGLEHVLDMALCSELLDEWGGWQDPSAEKACRKLQLPETKNRLMFPSTAIGTNTIMTDDEANTMRGHCSTSDGC